MEAGETPRSTVLLTGTPVKKFPKELPEAVHHVQDAGGVSAVPAIRKTVANPAGAM
jgi:hypothetical protein